MSTLLLKNKVLQEIDLIPEERLAEVYRSFIEFTEKTGFFECPAKITRVVHV